MPKKTQGVQALIDEVLQTFTEPYGEDVVEDVCLAIEHTPGWRRRNDELVDKLYRDVVNNWIDR